MLQNQAVEPATLSLLKELMNLPLLEDFYLVGGTALALQLGHRKSIDLDLFCDAEHDQDAILATLPKPYEEFSRSNVFLGCHIKGVKCDFVKYLFPRIEPLVIIEGVRMASLLEIASMKLWAITRRGSKKDFVDLYFLLKIFSLNEMLIFFRKKFDSIEPFMVVRSLTWFEDAEEDFDPVMLENVTWKVVKTEIVKVVTQFLEEI